MHKHIYYTYMYAGVDNKLHTWFCIMVMINNCYLNIPINI